MSVVSAVGLGAICLASFRWAFLASDSNMNARFYAGTFSYGCYERLRLPTLSFNCSIVPRTPTDYYGSFCHEKTVRAHLWPAPLASAAFAAVALVRRSRSGGCPRCGYSTAGLPTAVCPECGATRPNQV